MKAKLIILIAIVATLVYSCSNDRDEDVRKEAIEKVKSNNQKKEIKLNKSSYYSREAQSESKNDSIIVKSSNALGESTDTNLDPDDSSLIPPGDVKPPKGGR